MSLLLSCRTALFGEKGLFYPGSWDNFKQGWCEVAKAQKKAREEKLHPKKKRNKPDSSPTDTFMFPANDTLLRLEDVWDLPDTTNEVSDAADLQTESTGVFYDFPEEIGDAVGLSEDDTWDFPDDIQKDEPAPDLGNGDIWDLPDAKPKIPEMTTIVSEISKKPFEFWATI